MRLTIPNGHVVLLHESGLTIIHPSDVLVLLLAALVAANAVGEAKAAVVVDGVHGIGEDLIEAGEVHAETIGLSVFVGGFSTKTVETYVFPSMKRICSGSTLRIAGTMRS